MSTHKRLRCVAISCLLAFLARAAGAQDPQIISQEQSEVVQDWKNRMVVQGWERRLQTALDRLNQSDFKKARDIADVVLQEMIESIQGGAGAAPGLGTALLLRASAEAGLGHMDKAVWDWHTAHAVDPGITKENPSVFGPAGERLAAAVASATRKEACRAKAKMSEASTSGKSRSEGVSRPEKISGNPPKYPGGVSAACIEGTLVMDTVIDEKGTLHEPGLLQSPGGPVLTVALFEAMRNWRFKPARFEGRPVAVYYTLTVNFDVKTCRDAAAGALKKQKKRTSPLH